MHRQPAGKIGELLAQDQAAAVQARFQRLVFHLQHRARLLGRHPLDVALSLVGNPPEQTVLLWEHATVGGLALTSLLAEPERQRLARRIAAAWPPGPYALASAAAAAIDAMSGRTRRTLTCFVGPDISMGERTRTVALPSRLGAAGIERVMLPELSAGERVALGRAQEL